MAKFRIVLYSSNKRKDGSCPVCMRISKGAKLKYLDLGLSAKEYEWDFNADRFKRSKRINPNFELYNARLTSCEDLKNKVLDKFFRLKVDWTLEQFVEEFLGYSKQGRIYDYWMRLIEDLKSTGHIGNAKVYERDLHLFCKYDTKAKERLFSEIDVKYINRLNISMEKNGNCGNTRMHTLKTLRAVMNRAIKEKEASSSTYPFGKGGFEVNKLAEETKKRYLLASELELLKSQPQQNYVLERARRIYLFSYYCFGMSFVDMANLTSDNIERLASGEHIVYKRQKTKNAKNVKPIIIPVTPAIKEQLMWFKENSPLTSNYLLPIISKDYVGEQLYEHIRCRYKRINTNLKKLGGILDIPLVLTTYTARHTMAMTLQGNKVPREIISQTLGHSNITTTATYLDSFSTNVLDEVAKIL